MIEVIMKLFAISFSFLILAQAYLIKRYVGTYIFPASLFSLAWFLFTIIPLVTLFFVPINPLSILYILICVSAFSLSSLPFNWVLAYKTNAKKNIHDLHIFNSKFLKFLFYIFFLSSIIFSTVRIRSCGFDLYSILFNPIETSGRFAALRGHGQLENNIVGVIAIFSTYATPILGGLFFFNHHNAMKRFVILLISFVPGIYFMITQSSKLVVFFAIGFFCAAVLLMKIYSNKLILFNWHFIVKFVGFILILLPLISVSFLSRDGFSDFNDLERIIDILLSSFCSYSFGQLYAFSDFFSSYLGIISETNYISDFNTYGYYTFTSIFDFFYGDKIFPPGIFEEYYSYSNILTTNIYTIYRGLIYDFGGIGTVIFMFVIGSIIHFFFYLLLASKNSSIACAFFIVTIVFFQGTYLYSVFMARYMYLILISFIIIFWINNKYFFWLNSQNHRKFHK